uniref:Uncharacterized protein n=1 Tax=Nelumbo nucifera TaxID=4432 RepID=A0A822ZUM5_NELNU|nr:TPA_asm: hypothetical protein HUJ06_018611 [Nelumbo nucifera]
MDCFFHQNDRLRNFRRSEVEILLHLVLKKFGLKWPRIFETSRD